MAGRDRDPRALAFVAPYRGSRSTAFMKPCEALRSLRVVTAAVLAVALARIATAVIAFERVVLVAPAAATSRGAIDDAGP